MAVIMFTSAPIEAAESLPSGVRACAAQADAPRRLACYDKEVARLISEEAPPDTKPCPDAGCRNDSHVGTSVRPDADSHATKGSSAEDEFGLDGELLRKRQKEGGGQAKLQQLTARVATISHRLRGEMVLRLDNEQIWEQSEDGPDLRIKVGDTVTIGRGALGSYWLSAHSSLAIKVRRTR